MSKSISFNVAKNLDYYGSEAKESDIKDYAGFAESYLLEHGYNDVEINYVENYPSNDEQYELRQQVWDAFCGS